MSQPIVSLLTSTMRPPIKKFSTTMLNKWQPTSTGPLLLSKIQTKSFGITPNNSALSQKVPTTNSVFMLLTPLATVLE